MAGNSIGTLFKLTTFGESHGKAIGGIVDGCPSNISLDLEAIQSDLDRRKPGQSSITTQRKEQDRVEFLSGLFEGKTTGTPIGFIIHNQDSRSKDYDHLKDVYRPSHADMVYDKKYGIRDHRGGGRSSARETACRVVAGSLAKQVLQQKGVTTSAYVSGVYNIQMDNRGQFYKAEDIEQSIVRCPDAVLGNRMIDVIEQVASEGDSVGGEVTCVIRNVPIGIGEPVFDKLHADLAKGCMSINAVKAVEIGSGKQSRYMKGSEHNDQFSEEGGLTSNYSGGIQGGISNGEDIVVSVTFKPTATISKNQSTIDNTGQNVNLAASGRHDPCVVPRAVPIVEAMCLLTILDHYLRQQTSQLS